MLGSCHICLGPTSQLNIATNVVDVSRSEQLTAPHAMVATHALVQTYGLCLSCRAKLGEALERMNRVVQAIEQDALQPSPYPAQLARNMQQADTDTMSPALQQASGAKP